MKPKNARRRKMDRLAAEARELADGLAVFQRALFRGQDERKKLQHQLDQSRLDAMFLKRSTEALIGATKLPWAFNAEHTPATNTHYVTVAVSAFEWQQISQHMNREDWAIMMAYKVLDRLDCLTKKE
jgi:hypothetical protein